MLLAFYAFVLSVATVSIYNTVAFRNSGWLAIFPRGGSMFFSNSTTNLMILEVSACIAAAFGLLAVLSILCCGHDGFGIIQFVLLSVVLLVFAFGFMAAVGLTQETNSIQDDKYWSQNSTDSGLKEDFDWTYC